MAHSHLNNLSLMSIENELLVTVDSEDIINDFTNLKCRKQIFLAFIEFYMYVHRIR